VGQRPGMSPESGLGVWLEPQLPRGSCLFRGACSTLRDADRAQPRSPRSRPPPRRSRPPPRLDRCRTRAAKDQVPDRSPCNSHHSEDTLEAALSRRRRACCLRRSKAARLSTTVSISRAVTPRPRPRRTADEEQDNLARSTACTRYGRTPPDDPVRMVVVAGRLARRELEATAAPQVSSSGPRPPLRGSPPSEGDSIVLCGAADFFS
jgi:hypothetical protein